MFQELKAGVLKTDSAAMLAQNEQEHEVIVHFLCS